LSRKIETITPPRMSGGISSEFAICIDSGRTRRKTAERIIPEPMEKKWGFLIDENLRNKKDEIKGNKNKTEIPPNICMKLHIIVKF
jgi:hypothetical protein